MKHDLNHVETLDPKGVKGIGYWKKQYPGDFKYPLQMFAKRFPDYVSDLSYTKQRNLKEKTSKLTKEKRRGPVQLNLYAHKLRHVIDNCSDKDFVKNLIKVHKRTNSRN